MMGFDYLDLVNRQHVSPDTNANIKSLELSCSNEAVSVVWMNPTHWLWRVTFLDWLLLAKSRTARWTLARRWTLWINSGNCA